MRTLGLAAVLVGTIAFGQAPSKSREDAIWDAAANRIERQNDIWFKVGDYPRVIQALRLATGMLPTDYDLTTSLGWMLENIKQYDEALAVYIKFRKENPLDPDAAFPEANFYYMRKAYAKVPPLLEGSIKTATKTKPHANVFRILAHSYDRQALYADAKRVWSKLADLTQDPVAIRNVERMDQKMKGTAKR